MAATDGDSVQFSMEIISIGYTTPQFEQVKVSAPEWTLEDAQESLVFGNYPLGGE